MKQTIRSCCVWSSVITALVFVFGFLAGKHLGSSPVSFYNSWPSNPANSPCDLNDVRGDAILSKWRTGACSYSTGFLVFVVDRRGELRPTQTKRVAEHALNSLLQMKKQKLMRDLQDIMVPRAIVKGYGLGGRKKAAYPARSVLVQRE